ncbi:hypothetical protein H0H93_008129 [Arthromyces matolae]|nr:hypothetical protein H0H93_008129 [Arthromyces matolae]
MPQPPPDPAFIPRKEFLRDQKSTLSSFAIVTISGASLVRLYSFPSQVIVALRTLFEAPHCLVAFREDIPHRFCEFILAGKPWASPKNIRAEKLLVDIFAVIYQCGFTYLSTLDYGRESDDRVAMAFSMPTSKLTNSRPTTPPSTMNPPFRESSGSIDADRSRVASTPFALSFLSPTLMRVIAPPLHFTPAILQAVRLSWPRGVVSERKIGDNSFEFKFKGYKWFQTDTFSTDSLRHILTLLTSLDSHAFTLLSSISLSNRSRVKDLWVFTGPGDSARQDGPDAVEHSSKDVLNGDIPQTQVSDPVGKITSPTGPVSQHKRFVSEPVASSSTPRHARTATDHANGQNFTLTHGYRLDRPLMGPTLLRKPAPRAQVPVSVVYEAEPPATEPFRAHLPSTISTGVDNMTGVGTDGFIPREYHHPVHAPGNTEGFPNTAEVSPVPSSLPPTNPRTVLRPVAIPQTPPPLTSDPILLPPAASSETQTPSNGELLGPGAFRDSVTSNTSDTSFNIPIQWIGAVEGRNEAPGRKRSPKRNSSTGPMLPGGWQPSPIEEKYQGSQEDHGGITTLPENKGIRTPIHEVASRVVTPELTRPDMPTRKSEAAVVDLIPKAIPPPLPTNNQNGTDVSNPGAGKGQGWVLVNVAESANRSQPVQGFAEPHIETGPSHDGHEYPIQNPEATAIAMIDAIDNKKDKTGTITPVKRRLFSLRRGNSVRANTSLKWVELQR